MYVHTSVCWSIRKSDEMIIARYYQKKSRQILQKKTAAEHYWMMQIYTNVSLQFCVNVIPSVFSALFSQADLTWPNSSLKIRIVLSFSLHSMFTVAILDHTNSIARQNSHHRCVQELRVISAGHAYPDFRTLLCASCVVKQGKQQRKV